MHAIAYDEIHDEIVVPQQFGQAILVFDGGAEGEEPPKRYIQGSKTMLKAPDRLAVDPVNHEIYVPEGDKVLVFPRTASGNVAPTRVIQGPDTGLGADAVAVDTENDLLIVSGRLGRGANRRAKISIFDRTAEGNTPPKAVIEGPSTMVNSPRNVQVYNGWILIAQDGMQGRDPSERTPSFVAVFRITDSGDVAPSFTIGGPDGSLRKPRGIALDPDQQTVIVSDKFRNGIFTYSLPEIYEAHE